MADRGNGSGIVRAEPGDEERLAPIVDAYRRFHGQASDLAGTRRFLSDLLRERESIVLLARDAETAAGVAGYALLRSSVTTVGLGRTLVLHDLFVRPDARGRGLGRALLERARAHAREAGVRRIDLRAARANARARALYERLGFAPEEGDLLYSLRP